MTRAEVQEPGSWSPAWRCCRRRRRPQPAGRADCPCPVSSGRGPRADWVGGVGGLPPLDLSLGRSGGRGQHGPPRCRRCRGSPGRCPNFETTIPARLQARGPADPGQHPRPGIFLRRAASQRPGHRGGVGGRAPASASRGRRPARVPHRRRPGLEPAHRPDRVSSSVHSVKTGPARPGPRLMTGVC